MPVAVVEGQRGGEAGHGDAVLDACAHRIPPRLLETKVPQRESARERPRHGGRGTAHQKYPKSSDKIDAQENEPSFGAKFQSPIAFIFR